MAAAATLAVAFQLVAGGKSVQSAVPVVVERGAVAMARARVPVQASSGTLVVTLPDGSLTTAVEVSGAKLRCVGQISLFFDVTAPGAVELSWPHLPGKVRRPRSVAEWDAWTASLGHGFDVNCKLLSEIKAGADAELKARLASRDCRKTCAD